MEIPNSNMTSSQTIQQLPIGQYQQLPVVDIITTVSWANSLNSPNTCNTIQYLPEVWWRRPDKKLLSLPQAHLSTQVFSIYTLSPSSSGVRWSDMRSLILTLSNTASARGQLYSLPTPSLSLRWPFERRIFSTCIPQLRRIYQTRLPNCSLQD